MLLCELDCRIHFFPHRELWDLDDNQQLVGIWHKSTIWSAEIKLNFIRKIFLDTELQNQILEFFNIIIIIIFNVGVCIFNMACWKLESVVATIALCHLRGYFTIHFPKNKYIKTLGAFLYSFFSNHYYFFLIAVCRRSLSQKAEKLGYHMKPLTASTFYCDKHITKH